jgi:hypothetical protein
MAIASHTQLVLYPVKISKSNLVFAIGSTTISKFDAAY